MARDLAQESLMRAFTGLATYRAEMPFSGWLRAITANVCYDELRRRQRRPEDLVGDFGAAEQNWTQLVNHATPEDIVNAAEQRREAHDLAHRLLDALKPDDRHGDGLERDGRAERQRNCGNDGLERGQG